MVNSFEVRLLEMANHINKSHMTEVHYWELTQWVPNWIWSIFFTIRMFFCLSSSWVKFSEKSKKVTFPCHFQIIKVCRDWHNAGRMEANHPWRYFIGQQSLGRSGRVECWLLPNLERHHCQRHVRYYLLLYFKKLADTIPIPFILNFLNKLEVVSIK